MVFLKSADRDVNRANLSNACYTDFVTGLLMAGTYKHTTQVDGFKIDNKIPLGLTQKLDGKYLRQWKDIEDLYSNLPKM